MNLWTPSLSSGLLLAALIAASPQTASATAIFESWALAGVIVDGDVDVTTANSVLDPNGNTDPDLSGNSTFSAGASAAPSIQNFDNFDPRDFIDVDPPFDFDAGVAVDLQATTFPPDTTTLNSTASLDILLTNSTDETVVAIVQVFAFAISFLDVDAFPEETVTTSAQASVLGVFNSPSSANTLLVADDADPQFQFSENGPPFAQEVVVLAGETVTFSVIASAEGEATSNLVDNIVPEPTAALLLGLGIAGLAARRREV